MHPNSRNQRKLSSCPVFFLVSSVVPEGRADVAEADLGKEESRRTPHRSPDGGPRLLELEIGHGWYRGTRDSSRVSRWSLFSRGFHARPPQKVGKRKADTQNRFPEKLFAST